MDSSIFTIKHNSKSNWLNYWYQISETFEVSPSGVLIVGGSGIMEHTIKDISNEKARVITIDINNTVYSDIVGKVVNLPFEKDAFDVVVCCQALEHIPLDKFSVVLSELHRVAKKRVVMSVLHGRRYFRLAVTLPFIKEKSYVIRSPLTSQTGRRKQRYWEIGRGVSRKQLVSQITRLFEIEKEYLNEINCDSRFFILKRRSVWS